MFSASAARRAEFEDCSPAEALRRHPSYGFVLGMGYSLTPQLTPNPHALFYKMRDKS